MVDALDKAEDWRSRAGQLLRDASRTRDPLGRASLDEMAGAAEHHARNLAELAIKFRCLHRDGQRVTITADAAD